MGELKLVLNGSFRSGTSMLWQIVKDSNPGVFCFYEPCHPDLGDLIRQHPMGTTNDLHEQVLFDEYYRAFGSDDRSFDDPLSKSEVYPNTFDEVDARVAAFLHVDKPYVLQTNRWHYFLNELHHAHGCGLMHVLRNPFRVWDSIQSGVRDQGEFRYQFRRVLRNRTLGLFFGSDRIYEVARGRHSHPTPVFSTSLERFLVAWVLSNQAAVEATLSVGGTVLTYESILSSGGEVLDTLQIAGLSFSKYGSVRHKSVVFLTVPERQQIERICVRFRVEDKLDDLLKSIYGVA